MKKFPQWVGSEFLNELKRLYREVKFDERVVDNIFSSLNTNGYASILSLINAVKRKHGNNCEHVLFDVLSFFRKHFDAEYLVMVEDISKFGDPSEGIDMIQVKELKDKKFKCVDLSKKKGVILVSNEFWRSLSSLSSIFSSLWEKGSKFLPVLAWDKSGLLWDIIEGELLVLSNMSPPIILFLPYFHAYKYYGNRYKSLIELDKEIRELGLLKRVWGTPKSYDKRIISSIEELSNMNSFSHFLTAIIATLKGDLSLEDLYVFLLYIMGEKSLEAKFKIISRGGLFPSNRLKKVIEENECEDIDECVKKIRNALLEAEKRWFPEISIEEILNVPYGVEIENLVVEEWLREFYNRIINEKILYMKPEERTLSPLIPALKLALSLIASRINFKSQSLILLIRYLISLSNRLKYIAIPIVSNAIKAILNLEEDELEFSIYLQRFLEIHGPKPYITLGKDVFGEKFVYAVYLGLLINSKRGLGARKIIAYTLKSPTVSNIVSKHLACLGGFKVRGFTIPIPWELEVGASSRRIEWVKYSIRYFQEVNLSPPEVIKLLDNILSFRFNKEQIGRNIGKYDLKELVSLIAEISKLESLIERLRNILVEQFGVTDVKFVRSAEAMLSEVTSKLYKEFERRFVLNYKEILNEIEFVSKAIDIATKKFRGRPVILIVVDGLRFDDYLTKVKDKLKERHLKVIYDQVLFSYLPSITTFSRRAIFSGETPPKYLLFPGKISGMKLVKEGTYLSDRFNKSLYIKGSVGEIQIKLENMVFSGQLKGIEILAIVLSDLEKAAHGSSEGFLARLTMDYADEIAKIIQTAISVYFKVNKVIPIAILVSDHGLEKFTKIVEVSPKEIVRIAKVNGSLDPAFEVVTTPRYIIIPTLSTEYARRLILEIERAHKAKLWLKKASDLGIEKISMKLKDENLYNLVDGDRIIIVFPRGDKRFKVGPTRSVVYHGGPLPSEVLTPLAIIEPE